METNIDTDRIRKLLLESIDKVRADPTDHYEIRYLLGIVHTLDFVDVKQEDEHLYELISTARRMMFGNNWVAL